MEGIEESLKRINNCILFLLCNSCRLIRVISGHRALAAAPANASPARAEDASLRSVERAALQAQLKAHRGTRAELAQKLGISERSLYRKLRDIDLEPPA